MVLPIPCRKWVFSTKQMFLTYYIYYVCVYIQPQKDDNSGWCVFVSDFPTSNFETCFLVEETLSLDRMMTSRTRFPGLPTLCVRFPMASREFP